MRLSCNFKPCMQTKLRRAHARALCLTFAASVLTACSEATSPRAGAAAAQVVPIAVPDVWCPAGHDSAADTIPTQRRCHAVPVSPTPAAAGGDTARWHPISGSPVARDGDSTASSRAH
jgi:cytochrome c5